MISPIPSGAAENIRLNSDLVAIPHLRDRLRKLRWFVSAFKVHTSLVEQETGIEFAIDEGKMNRVFFDWIDSVDANRHGAHVDLLDFVRFAAGLALTSLAYNDPVSAERRRAPMASAGSVVSPSLELDHDIWPSGYLYVTFCLSVIVALERQEFGRVVSRLHEDARDSAFWGSLCENISADSRLAVPYLDRLLGKTPNWELPDSVMDRAAMLASVAGPRENAGMLPERGD